MKKESIEKVFETTYKGVLKIVLPTDKECDDWYDLNIDNDSASSAIYKFRLWLKDRANN